MKKEEVLRTIKANFDLDLKNKLPPLYDISQEVHEDTLSDLRELIKAIGDYAYDKGKEQRSR